MDKGTAFPQEGQGEFRFSPYALPGPAGSARTLSYRRKQHIWFIVAQRLPRREGQGFLDIVAMSLYQPNEVSSRADPRR